MANRFSQLLCFAQNASSAADRFIMHQSDASYRGSVNGHKAINQPIILAWLVWDTAVEKTTKDASACAGKRKRKFGGVETTKDPPGCKVTVASSVLFLFFLIAYCFSNVKLNIKLKVRRMAGGSKDSVMPPRCKAMVNQREVTSKRGR